MDMKLAKEYAKAISDKRGLEDQLSTVKDQIASLERSILNEMQENQIDRLPINLGHEKVTLYIHKQLWAKPKGGDRQAVIDTLLHCGLSDLVQDNYNSNSLSAYVRERLADGQKLQPTLEKVIDLTEVISVRGRRSSASSTSKTAAAMKTIRR
tara:strand:- start:233 stop:691 length:459 start_codon:yes stop_codon:yes gene_type:complete